MSFSSFLIRISLSTLNLLIFIVLTLITKWLNVHFHLKPRIPTSQQYHYHTNRHDDYFEMEECLFASAVLLLIHRHCYQQSKVRHVLKSHGHHHHFHLDPAESEYEGTNTRRFNNYITLPLCATVSLIPSARLQSWWLLVVDDWLLYDSSSCMLLLLSIVTRTNEY